MRKVTISIGVITMVIAMTIPIANAASEVTVFLPINKQWIDDRCVLNVYAQQNLTRFLCSWDWEFSQAVMQFLPPTDTPTFEEYQKSLIDYLNDQEDKTPEQIIEEQTIPEEEEIPQWMVALEEKKRETEDQLAADVKLLKECDAAKLRWSKIQSSEHIASLDIPISPFDVPDYAKADKKGMWNKMLEECRGMIAFEPRILQYENIIESATAVVDTTPAEDAHAIHEQKQDDATQAKLDQADFWLDWRCQPDQVKNGLCKENLDETARDPNKGGFTYDEDPTSDTFGEIIGTKDCGFYYILVDVGKPKKIPQKIEYCISDHQKIHDEQRDLTPEEIVARDKQLQCEQYMPHYETSEGGSIPQFLSHCAGYEETTEELEQTAETCTDCPKEQFEEKEVATRHCYEPGRGEVDCAKKDAEKANRERDN